MVASRLSQFFLSGRNGFYVTKSVAGVMLRALFRLFEACVYGLLIFISLGF